MTRRWDLRLVPVALAVWLCALLVLLAGVGSAILAGAACLLTWVGLTVWTSRGRGRGGRVAWSMGVLVALAAAAAVLMTTAHTQPARAFLDRFPGSTVVRVHAEVTGTPTNYTTTPVHGQDEAGAGTAVPLHVHRADGGPADVPVTVFATHESWAALQPGDRLSATVTVSDNVSPARLGARATSPPRRECHPSRGTTDPGLVTQLRSGLARLSAEHGPATAGLLPGMTVGDTTQVQEPLTEAMRATGLTHLTAVSGSNCALVMTLAGYAALLLGAGRRTCLLTGLCALTGFVLLVGPDPSVLRAALMGGLGAVAMLSGRNGVSLNALAAAVAGLVLTVPALAVDFGFVLSVLATAGIVVSGRAVTRLLARRLPLPVALSVAVPLVAQWWCGPVLLLLNPALPLYSLPANMVVGPMVPLVTVCGLLAVLVLLGPALVAPGTDPTGWVLAWERAAHLPLWLASYPTRFIAWAAEGIASLPGSQVPWPEGVPGLVLLTVLTVAVLGGLHLWDAHLNRPRPDHGTLDPRPAAEPVPDSHWRDAAATRRRRRRTLALAVLLTLAALVTYGLVHLLRPAPPWDSVVCDVGQGDAVLHRTGEHSAVLVDAGPDPRALTRCLRQAGITRLDALVVTHDHADHTDGLSGLQDVVDVGTVWYSTAGPDLPADLLPWAERARRPATGETLTLGETTLTVLSAPASPAPTGRPSSQDENNASLVLRVTVTGSDGPTTWLTAGDLETDGYRALRRSLPDPAVLDTDVLKVSHHGARNGGTDIITDATPVLAVISVGRENGYGHPHASIVSALRDHGIHAVRTDEHGSLWIRADGHRISVSTR